MKQEDQEQNFEWWRLILMSLMSTTKNRDERINNLDPSKGVTELMNSAY